MKTIVKTAIITTLFSAVVGQTAFAQAMVLGKSKASECYQRTKTSMTGQSVNIKLCKQALYEGGLTKSDKAATHVNLGILLMRAKRNAEARKHYEKAIAMTPDLPEAYINNSAALIYMGEYHAAVTAIDKAIDLGTTKMPEALFNRAMAYDHLKNYNRAYADLKKALELRPSWAPALSAIDNYEVTPVVKSN